MRAIDIKYKSIFSSPHKADIVFKAALYKCQFDNLSFLCYTALLINSQY